MWCRERSASLGSQNAAKCFSMGSLCVLECVQAASEPKTHPSPDHVTIWPPSKPVVAASERRTDIDSLEPLSRWPGSNRPIGETSRDEPR